MKRRRTTQLQRSAIPPWRRLASALVAGCSVSLAACSSEPSNVVHQERSLYRNIYVTQDGDQRCMAFRVRLMAGPQGCISIRNPDVHALEYSKLEMASLYVVPNPRKILVVGLGVGVTPRTLQQMYPEAEIDVVEIDPAVVKLARSYFDYVPGPKSRVVVDDGRRFVRQQLRTGVKYDLISLDAFNGEYIPEHLVTAEFLTEVKRLLSPTGVVAANTWSTSKLFDSESATYAKVFGGFVSINRDNRIILATAAGPPDVEAMKRNAEALESRLRRYGVSKTFLLPLLNASPKWDRSATVLTDQYSPANLLNE